MAIAYVSGSSGNANTNTTSATSQSLTVTAVPSGAAVCITVLWYSTVTTATVKDNLNNSYTQLDSQNISNFTLVTFYGTNVAGGPTTFTATFASAVQYPSVTVDTFTGVATSAALDGHTAQTQTSPGTGSNAITSGTFTEASSGDLTFSAVMDTRSSGVSGTPGTGFTAAQAPTGYQATEYKLSSSSGSNAGTWTNGTDGGTYTFITAAFALKAAGAGGKPSSLPLLGVGMLMPSDIALLGAGAAAVEFVRRNPMLSRRRFVLPFTRK
jgi:hypothetical protein